MTNASEAALAPNRERMGSALIVTLLALLLGVQPITTDLYLPALPGLAWAGVVGPWAIAVPQLFFAFGHGIHQPCGQAAVVGPFPNQAGAASALAGFILAATAVAVGAWLGATMDDTVLPLTNTVGVMALATALVGWTLVQRHGEIR